MAFRTLFILAVASAAPVQAQEKQEPFLSSFEEGMARARKEGKPLFVDFGHPW